MKPGAEPQGGAPCGGLKPEHAAVGGPSDTSDPPSGARHWLHITGLPGWRRARLGVPAFRHAKCLHRAGEDQGIPSSAEQKDTSSMKIAIPAENGRMHGHFGGCREFALVEVDQANQRIVRSEAMPAPDHQPGLFPRWLRSQGVQVVIAGGIGHRALANFAQHGITVCAGPVGSPVEALVADFLSGKLTEPPAGCEHHGDHHHPHHSDDGETS